MPTEKTVLFLYTRLPDYFYRCIQHFVNSYSCKAVIVRYKDDVNTRYSFNEDKRILLYNKDEINLSEFVTKINPAAIMVSTWGDKEYKTILKRYVKHIPVILGLDNPWSGTLKQKLFSAAAPLVIFNICNMVWTAGASQYEYARRLGFKKQAIFPGLYSADAVKFYEHQEQTVSIKKTYYPRTIVYVGRMVEYKQPHILARIFNEIVSMNNSGWKLILAGEGPLKEIIRNKNYKNVELTDFISPAALPEFYKSAGIFCLPSKGEHWGVAVHEATAAGLPLLLSDTVESGSAFLINGYNGFSFETGNERSFREYMLRMLNMTNDELLKMGENSRLLSRRINHDTWAATLNSVID